MSVTLTSRDRHVRLNSGTWVELLGLATGHGWRPAGTCDLAWESDAEDAEDADVSLADAAAAVGHAEAVMAHVFEREAGSAHDHVPARTRLASTGSDYSSNNGQLVLDHDAANLAGALSQALDACTHHIADARRGTDRSPTATRDQAPQLIEAWSNPEGSEVLREVLAFCRRGEFTIW